MVINFLFQDIIAAPLAEDYKVELQTRQLRRRLSGHVAIAATNARGAMRATLSVARNSVSQVMPDEWDAVFRKPSIRESFALLDTQALNVSRAVLEAHGSTSMMLENEFAEFIPESLHDAEERGELNGAYLAASALFFKQLCDQSEQLDGSLKKDFQERWALVPNYDGFNTQSGMFASDDVVSSGTSASIRGMLFCGKVKKTRKQALAEIIEDVSAMSKEKIKKLQLASDEQVGLEIMHLFIIELLG